MSGKKTLILLVLLLSIISLTTVSATDNITQDVVGLEEVDDEPINVEKTQLIEKTENDDVLKEGNNSFGDLEKLINSAEPGSTIVLDRDYINNGYEDYGIKIKKDITIDGQGHTLDGHYKSRMFKVSDDSKVIFKNITFIRGKVQEKEEGTNTRGGAINGYCTAINCYFNDNRANGHGGAMYLGTAINCTFKDNEAVKSESSATYQVDAKFSTFISDGMLEGSRFLCLMKDGSESKDTNIIVPSFTMTGDTTTILGGKIAFEMEYDGQKYDGYDVLISTTKNNGDEEEFHSSTGSEWTIPFVESRDYVISVNGYPEIKQYTGKFVVYSDVLISGNNFITWYNYDDNLTIRAVDNLNRPMVNISISYEINGKITNVTTDDNGQIIIPIDDLNPDNYVINIKYNGTDHYTGLNKTITLTINKGITKLIPNNLITTYNVTQYLEITLTDNKGNTLNNTKLYVELNGTEEYITDDHGKIKISTEGLAPGTYEYQVTFKENDFYEGSATTAKTIVNKISTRLTANPVVTFYNIDDELVIYLFDAFGNPLSNTTMSVNLNKTKNHTTDKNGRIKVNTKDLAPNEYQAKILFGGNEIYSESNATAKVVVNKGNPKLILTSLSTDYNSSEKFIIKLIDNVGNPIAGETVQFTLSVSKNTTDENGKILFSTNVGEGWEISIMDNQGNPTFGTSISTDIKSIKNFTTDDNGQIKIAIKNVVPNTYFANVAFNGNEFYLESNATSKIVVNKQSTTLTANSITTVFNEDKDLIITLTDSQEKPISGVQVSVDLRGVKNYTTDKNGQVNISTRNLIPGNYIAKIKFNENYYYTGTSAETAVIVKKATTKLSIESLNDGASLVITLTDSENNPVGEASVSVDLNGIKNYITDSKGQIEISTPNDSKSFDVKISFEENENYTGSRLETKVIVKKTTILTADPVTTTYGVAKNLVITLKDRADNPVINASVSVDLNGIKNYTTDKNGHIKIPLQNLTPDKYDIKIKFDGNDSYTDSNTETTVTVKKITTKLTANAVITTYNVNKNLVIRLKDHADNPIINASVYVDLKGIKNYTTDENGQIKIPITNLALTNYTAKIKFDGNDSYEGSSTETAIIVEKLTSNLTANNVTATYNDDKYLVISLKDNANQPIVNASVSVNLKGIKNYTTDENGQIKIPVQKLTPKTYVAKFSYGGDNNHVESDSYGVIVVKKATPKLTAKAKTFKVKTKTKKYGVILKTNKNKAIRNTKVYLKVKGKTYAAKTNSKGKATFKITKLTKKGKFIAVVTYKGSAYYNKVAKKVKIKIR